MILGFEHFHPLRGVLPETFPEFGGDIVFRARALLSQRSEEEILAAIEIINWMIDQSPAQDEALAELEKGAAEDTHGINERVTENIDNSCVRRDLNSATYALKAHQAKYDITGVEKFPNASWAELFAVLALSLIGQACEDERLYDNRIGQEDGAGSDWFHEYRTVSHAAYWLIEAMDAVATAEGIHRFESGLTDAKQKVSIRNRHAAIKRHAKTNEAIVALRDFFIPEKHKSMRNAALLFIEAFPGKVGHLAHYNRMRTLSEGLSSLLKDQRRSLKQ